MPGLKGLPLLRDSPEHTSAGIVPLGKSAFLVRELRDSHPYLRDKGWHNVATLMLAAADELERLDDRVRELESRTAAASGRAERWKI